MHGRALLALLVALLLGGCASLGGPQRTAAAQLAVDARSTLVDCAREDACALDTPLRELDRRAFADSTPDAPRHYATLIDYGQDSLLARIALIRSARRSIDLQTYIFDEDDSAQLVMDELQAAAHRGVRVRLLLDQLAALERVETLAALASFHANFELRLYNPVLDSARLALPMYAVAAACCWRRLNQRMHSKLLLVDDAVGITGGRNYQDNYYDWDDSYNFRDRDLLVAGPVAAEMAANFEAFWASRRSVPAERLGDVARLLRRQGAPPPPHHVYRRPERVQALLARVEDAALVRERLVEPALALDAPVRYIADDPVKHRRRTPAAERAPASNGLRQLIAGAQREVLLQTPYLVMSKSAQDLFRDLHRRPQPPRVLISTNSLAATDAFLAYAISYKYKRRYLRDLGFEVHEYKPFPAEAPFEPEPADAARADGAGAGTQRPDPGSEATAVRTLMASHGLPVRLKRTGMRIGLHAKSMVVDERVGVVGTHNFDPRGEGYNTEAAVVVEDAGFARRLAASIRGDMTPGNAWTIGRRDPPRLFPGIEYTLAKLSSKMPLIDLWPIRYSTSYEFMPGPDCPPPPPSPFDHDFRRCHRPAGDFPEVDIGLKWLGVQIFTAIGSGLAPIF